MISCIFKQNTALPHMHGNLDARTHNRLYRLSFVKSCRFPPWHRLWLMNAVGKVQYPKIPSTAICFLFHWSPSSCWRILNMANIAAMFSQHFRHADRQGEKGEEVRCGKEKAKCRDSVSGRRLRLSIVCSSEISEQLNLFSWEIF